jgi:hypothetical protein
MRKTRLALFAALALSLVAISTLAAQQPNKGKKPPKQTHDRGIDDPDPSPALQPRLGERTPEGVTVSRRADGVLVAQLDESFEDALLARVNADGSISFVCLHGLPAAAKHVQAPAQPVSAAPVLEEK